MTQLSIDNKAKTIQAELMLDGEKEPITVRISGYVLGEGELRVGDVTVSRAWMQQLAKELLAGKPLPVPPEVAKYLRLVL